MIESPKGKDKAIMNMMLAEEDVRMVTKVVQDTDDFTLTSAFNSYTIYLYLEQFNHKEKIASFYELSLTKDSLPEKLICVFKDIEILWRTCFQSQKNYFIEEQGQLLFYYSINLDKNKLPNQLSLPLFNQLSLPLQLVQKPERDRRISYALKLQKTLKALKKDIRLLRNKIACSLLPLQNNFYHLFTVKKNIVEYKNTADFCAMLCLNTALVDEKNFTFKVRPVKEKQYYKVGIITQSSAHQQTCDGSRHISYDNSGQVYQDREYSKIKSCTSCPIPNLTDQIELTVNLPNDRLTIQAFDGNSPDARFEVAINLQKFPKGQRIIPFIQMSATGDSVHVYLK